MKYKFLCGFLISFLLMFSFSACTKSTSEKSNDSKEPDQSSSAQSILQDNPVSVLENYWHLSCKNVNVIFYKNLTGSRGLEFELVSAFPFDSDELSIEVESENSNISYKTSCDRDLQGEEEPFPFYIYQCYKGMDWNQLAELNQELLESDSQDTEIIKEIKKIQDMYLEEYQEIQEQGKFPQLYRYMVGISFNLDKLFSVEHIKAISLTLRGETKRYVLDSFILDAEREFVFENDGISMTYAICDAPIYVSFEGLLDLTYFNLLSSKPFTLTGIAFLEDDVPTIIDCSVIITQSDGTENEMKWDTKTPLQILGGESVEIHAICKDPQLASTMEAVTSKYISIQYITEDGRECTELVQILFRMRQGLYDLYAISDEVDVLSFYLDYYSVTTGLNQIE